MRNGTSTFWNLSLSLKKKKKPHQNDVVEKLVKVYEKKELERVLKENGNGE
jgi:hypothetical protein